MLCDYRECRVSRSHVRWTSKQKEKHMTWNWRLALVGAVAALLFIVDWGTYLIDWLFPERWPLIVGGVEY
jgi:hypothetical protein